MAERTAADVAAARARGRAYDGMTPTQGLDTRPRTPAEQAALDNYLRYLNSVRDQRRAAVAPEVEANVAAAQAERENQARAAANAIEQQRQQLLDYGKQRSQQLAATLNYKNTFSKGGVANLTPTPYAPAFRQSVDTRSREITAVTNAARNYKDSNGTPEQKANFLTEFLSTLTGESPDNILTSAPSWQTDAQTPTITDIFKKGGKTDKTPAPYLPPYSAPTGFFGVDPGETGFVNREFYLPVNINGSGPENLNPRQYSALEAVYRMVYGPGAVPSYNSEGFSGDAADMARAALKTYRTDQAAANNLMEQARIVRDTAPYGGVEAVGNPFWSGQAMVEAAARARQFNIDQTAADADVFARTLSNAQAKLNEEKRKKEDSGLGGLLKKAGNALKIAQKNDPYNQAGLGLSGVGRGGGNPFRDPDLVNTLSLLGIAKEQFFDIPYYAMQRAKDLGYGNTGSAAVGIWSLPGLRLLEDKLAPAGASQVTASVNNPEKRQVLRETQGLTSFGENLAYDLSNITGEGKYDATLGDMPAILAVAPYLAPVFAAPKKSAAGQLAGWLKDRQMSGVFDIAAQVAFDPLTYSPFVTSRLGKPAELLANYAVREEASALARRGATKLAERPDFVINVADRVALRAAALDAAEEARGGVLRGLQGFIRPGAFLDDAARSEIQIAAREAWLGGRQGQKWFGQAEQAIATSGGELKALTKKFPDLDSTLAREVVFKAQNEGTEAAIDQLRQFVRTGAYVPQVNVRRQVASLFENSVTYDSSIAGRNVPILLGRTSIKKNGGSVLNVLEKAAGRTGIYGHVFGSTSSEKVVNVAGRVASLNDSLPMDFWRTEVAPIVERLDFNARLNRVRGLLDGEVGDGVVRLTASLKDEIGDLARKDPTAAETTVRSLEYIAGKVAKGTEEEKQAAELLLKRITGAVDDPFAQALDNAASLLGGMKPRLKKLEELKDVQPLKYKGRLLATPKDYEGVLSDLEKATKQLIKSAGGRDAQLSVDLERHAKLIETLAGELDASAALTERRAVLRAAWKEQDDQWAAELRDGKALLKAQRDELREYRKGLRDYELKHRAINAKKSYHDRVSSNADLMAWVKEQDRGVSEALSKSMDDQRRLERTIDMKRKVARTGYTAQANSDKVLNLEEMIARSIEETRAQLRPGGEAAVRRNARATENALKEIADEAGPDRVKRYIAVKSFDPTGMMTDPLIKRTIETYDNLYTAEPFSLTGWARDWSALNAPNDEAVRAVSRGEKLLGPIPNDAAGRGALHARMQALPPGLRVYFAERINDAVANGANDLYKLGQEIERVAANPEFAHAVADQLTSESRLAEFLADNAGKGARKNFSLTRKPAHLALSFMESVAPRSVRWASHENAAISIINRIEDMDRVLMDYEWDATTRAEVRRLLVSAQTQDDVHALVKDMLTAYADQLGIPPGLLLSRQTQMWTEQKVAFMVKEAEWRTKAGLGPLPERQVLDQDATQVLQGTGVLSQRSNQIPILSADDARVIARAYLADNADSRAVRAFAKVRNAGSSFVDAEWDGRLAGGASLRKAAKVGHSFWKLAVVTNAPVGMLVGGTAGVLYGDPFKDNDSFYDRLKWGAIGGAIGSLGGIRYIARVAGIEERLRMAIARGFAPRDWIPGIAAMDDHGLELAMRHPEELVGTSAWASSHITQGRLLVGEADEWVAIAANDPFFMDAWARVVNRQLNPERNMIDRIVLQNFDSTTADWRVLAKEWLTKTNDGNVELRKLLGGLNLDGKARDVEAILDNYADFVSTYLPTEDLRLARLSNPDGIPMEVLKQNSALGNVPDVVHAQRIWRFPKSLGDLKTQYQQSYSKLVLERPTTKVNRVPMAKGIYAEEFRGLRRAGVEVNLARDLAEERAYRLTNKVMFQLNDESRFAAKADMFFPFQQPREELLRVYGSLVASNPARTVRLGRLGALAFNNGVSDGIFYEDAMGEYRMRVPGSAWLSRVFAPPGTEGAQSGFDFRVRDLFFLLQGNAFAASDGQASPSGLLLGTMPAPGGPYWQAATAIAMKVNPDWFETLQKNHPFIYERLYPYGTGGSLLRQESNRLWMAFAKSTPPWEFLTSDQQQDQLNRITQQVMMQMLYAHKDDPNYVEYLNTDAGKADVQNNVSGMLLAWAAVGSVTPAATRPYFPGQAEFDSLVKTMKAEYGEEKWVSALWNQRPDLAEVYMAKKTKFVGDTESFEDWLASQQYDQNDMTYGRRDYLSLDEFANQFAEARKRTEAMKELSNAWDGIYIHSADRYAEVEAVKTKWKNKGVDLDDSYLAEKDLARILYAMPKGQQDNAINEWRVKFGISGAEFQKMLKNIRNFKVDVRREARDIDAIRQEIAAAQRQNDGRSLESIVAALPNVAEQEKYWQSRISDIVYADSVSPYVRDTYGDDFANRLQEQQNQAPVTDFYAIKGRLSELYSTYGNVLTNKAKPPKLSEEMEKMLTGANGDAVGALNDKISQLYEAGAAAAKKKDWTTYYALKDQREQLRQQKQALLESVYRAFPDINEFQQDLAAITVFANNPDSAVYKKNLERLQSKLSIYGVPVIAFTSEERNYRDMPYNVRAAFKATLVDRLNKEKGEEGKLYWERLTPFQKSLLEPMVPQTALEKWKAEDPNAKSPKDKKYYGGGRYGSRTSAQTELAYAYELMKQANKRAPGAKPPAAYAEYRLIPASNPAARATFLKDHPEVQEWIRSGPMANMSVIDQMIVANIMVKYGKWEGEEMSAEELTNLAWAKQQMETWSRRDPSKKPDTYDIWLNMPTGPEKAAYIEAHPEIGEWVKAGPMSNMPDAYREVVRSIMTQYGQWSASSDPLGETLSAFYATPAAGRQAFLDAHPELRSYWKAIRTPEEQHIADLSEQYFALPSSGARSVFLSAHPELQTHFVESRQKRYERFLNQVAMYMGANPSLFGEYMNKQTAVLNELISRFGQPSLVREKFNAPTAGTPTKGTSGRVRRPAA